MLKEMFPDALGMFKAHVANLSNEGYRRGLDVAEEINYDMEVLKSKILIKAKEIEVSTSANLDGMS
jgi:hypothetical protein